MGPLGRPIGVWIATLYLLGLLASASNASLAMWRSSPIFVASLAASLSSVVFLWLLNRWAVLTTAVMTVVQAGFYLVYLLDPASVPALLGLGSPSHDVYVVPIQGNVAPLLYLAANAAVTVYAAVLWRAGVLG